MSRYKIHTNIALDYPAFRSGYIYTSDNIQKLFGHPKFKNKINKKLLFGSYNNVSMNFPVEQISHVVVDAFVSGDKEIMFEVATLNNDIGRELSSELETNPLLLAKIVARLSNIVVGGKLKVYDIKYVHITDKVTNESTNTKEN